MLIFSLIDTGRKIKSKVLSAHLWNISKKFEHFFPYSRSNPPKMLIGKGVLKIYRRTPMPKHDFNNVVK